MPRTTAPLQGPSIGGYYDNLLLRIGVNITSKNMENLFRHERGAKEAVETGMGQALVATTVKAAQRMSDVLKRDHRFRVGYTEKASENLMVIPAGNHHWAVVEGPLTPANRFIRRGWRSSRTPNPEAIMRWIERKPGVKEELFTEAERDRKTGTYRFTKRGGANADMRKQPGRIFKKDEQRFREFAFLIGRKIKARGGSKHFEALDPAGDPVFDYVRYALFRSNWEQFKSEYYYKYSLSGLKYVVEYLQSDGRSPGNVPVRKVIDVDKYRL